MTIEEATGKVKKMAENHSGKFGNKINFKLDDGVIHLDDTVSPPIVENVEKDSPCSLKMTLENFEKLLSGDLNPMMAFMTGKMKVEGDKGVAMKLAGLF